MFNNKKAQVEDSSLMLKMLIILISSSVIAITWIVAVIMFNSISINDEELKVEIVATKLVEECFTNSNVPGIIESSKYNQETIDNCLKGLDENFLVATILNERNILFLEQREQDHIHHREYCFSGSTTKCHFFSHRIIFRNQDSSQLDSTIRIEILVT